MAMERPRRYPSPSHVGEAGPAVPEQTALDRLRQRASGLRGGVVCDLPGASGRCNGGQVQAQPVSFVPDNRRASRVGPAPVRAIWPVPPGWSTPAHPRNSASRLPHHDLPGPEDPADRRFLAVPGPIGLRQAAVCQKEGREGCGVGPRSLGSESCKDPPNPAGKPAFLARPMPGLALDHRVQGPAAGQQGLGQVRGDKEFRGPWHGKWRVSQPVS